jgi:hypothetical protein
MPFANAKISGEAIIINNANINVPWPFGSDECDDAFRGAVITGGIISHRSADPHIGLALINQRRGNKDQQRILSQKKALIAAIESLVDSDATAAGSNTAIDKNKNRASSGPRATTSPDNPDVLRANATDSQFDDLAFRFAVLFAKDTAQTNAIVSSLTGK